MKKICNASFLIMSILIVVILLGWIIQWMPITYCQFISWLGCCEEKAI